MVTELFPLQSIKNLFTLTRSLSPGERGYPVVKGSGGDPGLQTGKKEV